MASRRIQKEYADLLKSPTPGLEAKPRSEADLMQWQGHIDGPAGSPYEGGVFKFEMAFTVDYPFKPPTVKFVTKIYHPNIDESGAICLGLLKNDMWKPATKIYDVLIALLNLIAEPNPDDPLSGTIAEQYRSDRPSFDAKAKAWVKEFAQP